MQDAVMDLLPVGDSSHRKKGYNQMTSSFNTPLTGHSVCIALTVCTEDYDTISGDRLFLWFLAAGMPVSVNFIPFQVPSETSLGILTVSTDSQSSSRDTILSRRHPNKKRLSGALSVFARSEVYAT